MNFLHSEKLFIILISLAAILFNAFPYYYQYKNAPENKVYIGSYPIIYDKPTYLAEMVQGEAGNWRMIDMYTTEPQKPVFLYPLYLGLGHVARITDISVENVFLTSRFVFGIILLFTVLYFIKYFIDNQNQRKVAYFLALFASGLGWVFLSSNNQSIDLGMVPETIPLVRFSYFPHFSVSHILLLSSLLLFYRSLKEKNIYSAAISGILAFILNFILPFTSLFLYFLIAMLLAIIFIKKKSLSRKDLKNALIFFAISMPSLLYMYYVGTEDPVWKIIEKQNLQPAAPLIRIITGYGLAFLFSMLGLYKMLKDKKLGGYFFSIWIFGAIILTRIPAWIFPMQKRFLETALYVPIAITASFGIKAIYDHFKNKNIKFLRIKFIFVFLLLAAPVLLTGNIQAWLFFRQSIQSINDAKTYLPKENIEAMQWLRQNSPSDAIILASFVNSNVIPQFADRFTYIGHYPMTINADEKLKIEENFYSGKYSADEMASFLEKEKISYILYSEEEKISEDGKALEYFDPDDYSFLKKIYQNKKMAIYKFSINK